MTLVLTGSAWIARADGSDDYDAFAKAARDRTIVLSSPSNNRILLARNARKPSSIGRCRPSAGSRTRST